MSACRVLVGAGLVVAGFMVAGCTPTGGGGGTTTTVSSTTSTTPAAAGRVAGLTENQVCAGPVSPAGCTTPFTPASDGVTISSGTVLVRKLQSATNGVFTVDLAPGVYNLDASTTLAGGAVDCPVVPVVITSGVTVAVTLHCTLELP